jgi:hypothetical protein
MMIDGLKDFLTEVYSVGEKNISPIKNFQETFKRSIIQLRDKAIVIEATFDKFEIEIVDNTSTTWKTLGMISCKTEEELFKQLRVILRSKSKISTKQLVAIKQNKVFDFLSSNQHKKYTYAEIGKNLCYTPEEVARLVANLRKMNKIMQNKNKDRTNSYEVIQ